MGGMVSFSPKDVIFLLNKWDTIAHEDDEHKEKFLEKTKQNLRKSWKEVEDSCIFMISAYKVHLQCMTASRAYALDAVLFFYYQHNFYILFQQQSHHITYFKLTCL